MTIPAANHTTIDTRSEQRGAVPSAMARSLDAVLRPVRSGNAFEEATQRIMQAIRLGAVTVGERLPPERTLAKRLGISRVTLREALHALTDAGVVESRRGRSGGTFITYQPENGVIPTTPLGRSRAPYDLDDSLVLRAVLEPGAAEAAARRAHGDTARATLRERLRVTAAATTPRSRRLADARLHLTIAELSGSTGVIAAVADVQMRLFDLLETLPPHDTTRFDEQHSAVVDAILAGRPEDARRHMHEHVHTTATLLQDPRT